MAPERHSGKRVGSGAEQFPGPLHARGGFILERPRPTARAGGLNSLRPDIFHLPPLHAAAQNGSKDVAELLLAKRADINAKDNDGKTPLKVAKKAVADLLRAHGAKD